MNKICACSISSTRRPERSRGFGAVAAVLLVSSGVSALSLSTLAAAVSYSDQIYHEEMRTQAGLDESACQDTGLLIRAKDPFAKGTVHIADLGCDVDL